MKNSKLKGIGIAIPDFPNYILLTDGSVYKETTGKKTKIVNGHFVNLFNKERRTMKSVYKLYAELYLNKKLSKSDIVEYFGEFPGKIDSKKFRIIKRGKSEIVKNNEKRKHIDLTMKTYPDFPNYLIGKNGVIINKETYKSLKVIRNGYVNLINKDGKVKYVSHLRLIYKTYVNSNLPENVLIMYNGEYQPNSVDIDKIRAYETNYALTSTKYKDLNYLDLALIVNNIDNDDITKLYNLNDKDLNKIRKMKNLIHLENNGDKIRFYTIKYTGKSKLAEIDIRDFIKFTMNKDFDIEEKFILSPRQHKYKNKLINALTMLLIKIKDTFY